MTVSFKVDRKIPILLERIRILIEHNCSNLLFENLNTWNAESIATIPLPPFYVGCVLQSSCMNENIPLVREITTYCTDGTNVSESDTIKSMILLHLFNGHRCYH